MVRRNQFVDTMPILGRTRTTAYTRGHLSKVEERFERDFPSKISEE
jgi:hypothetical protein